MFEQQQEAGVSKVGPAWRDQGHSCCGWPLTLGIGTGGSSCWVALSGRCQTLSLLPLP